MCKQLSYAYASTFAIATAAQYLKAGGIPGTLANDGPAGWGRCRDPSNYVPMLRQWRQQDPHYQHEAPPQVKVVGNLDIKE